MADTSPKVWRFVADFVQEWGFSGRHYLGVVVPGYPNLFCVYGPNTNTLSGSTIIFSECAVCYIMGCIKLLLERGERSLECRQDVHDAYNRIVDKGSLQVAWGVSNVPSWYKNKAGRVTRNWPFKVLEYWNRTKSPDAADFTFR